MTSSNNTTYQDLYNMVYPVIDTGVRVKTIIHKPIHKPRRRKNERMIKIKKIFGYGKS